MKVDALKFDALLSDPRLATMGELVRRIGGLGYDGLLTAEVKRDPFLPLAVAAEHAGQLDLGTSVAVAFPRNPMHLAQIGHDLQTASGGRFILGLGSQIRTHIEKRFGIDWSRPADRMEELVLALRAIWRCWNEGEPLSFEGAYYRHTLMTPNFDPGPTRFGPPRVFLGAVGPAMSEVAGRVADGLFLHGFVTPQYLQKVIAPALEGGLATSGRSRADVEVGLVLFTISGGSEFEAARAREAVRAQIAFYGSTPAYRPVLEVHGWGDLQPELNHLSKLGEWEEMARLVSDEIVDVFAVDTSAGNAGTVVAQRFGGLVDRVAFLAPYEHDADHWGRLMDAFAPVAV